MDWSKSILQTLAYLYIFVVSMIFCDLKTNSGVWLVANKPTVHNGGVSWSLAVAVAVSDR